MTEPTPTPVCATWDGDLSAWIDGELAEPRAREVQRHVAACVHCRARIDALHTVDGALRTLSHAPLTNREGAGLERVRARLEASRRAAPDVDPARARPALVAAPAGPPSIGPSRTEPAPRRRRRLLSTSLAAVAAAIALGVLVLPALLEPSSGEAPGGRDVRVLRDHGAAGELAARPAAQPIARDRAAAIEPPQPSTPGHLGASVPTDSLAESGDDAVADPSRVDPADQPLVDRLDALELLPRVRELSDAERRGLAERLDPLGAAAAADREQVRDNAERWRATQPPEREALRHRWRSFQALTPAERERLFDVEPPAS
jgi:hypothetical protein